MRVDVIDEYIVEVLSERSRRCGIDLVKAWVEAREHLRRMLRDIFVRCFRALPKKLVLILDPEEARRRLGPLALSGVAGMTIVEEGTILLLPRAESVNVLLHEMVHFLLRQVYERDLQTVASDVANMISRAFGINVSVDDVLTCLRANFNLLDEALTYILENMFMPSSHASHMAVRYVEDLVSCLISDLGMDVSATDLRDLMLRVLSQLAERRYRQLVESNIDITKLGLYMALWHEVTDYIVNLVSSSESETSSCEAVHGQLLRLLNLVRYYDVLCGMSR